MPKNEQLQTLTCARLSADGLKNKGGKGKNWKKTNWCGLLPFSNLFEKQLGLTLLILCQRGWPD